MAAHLQLDPGAVHLPIHDIESFFWVVLYATLHWFTPELEDSIAQTICFSLFEEIFVDSNPEESVGGGQKSAEITLAVRIRRLTRGTLLQRWLDRTRNLLSSWTFMDTITAEAAFKQFADEWHSALTEDDLVDVGRISRTTPTTETKRNWPATPLTGTYPPTLSGLPYAPRAQSIPPHESLEYDPEIGAKLYATLPPRIKSAKRKYDADWDDGGYKESPKRRRTVENRVTEERSYITGQEDGGDSSPHKR